MEGNHNSVKEGGQQQTPSTQHPPFQSMLVSNCCLKGNRSLDRTHHSNCLPARSNNS